MAVDIFLGEPPANIKSWIIEHCTPVADPDTHFTVQTTLDRRKSGIYSAERDDTTKPIVIDWGDGTVEQVNGNVSQKVHTYATVGTFEATISNVKTFAASADDYGWYSSTSQNGYTLKEVALGSSVTNIGGYAFYNCYELTGVTINTGVTSIGNWAFYNCSELTSMTIPDSVTSIGDDAFGELTGLTNVTIPNSVTSIGFMVFYNDYLLASVTFEGKTLSQIQSMTDFDNWFTAAGPDGDVTVIGTDGSIVVHQGSGGPT